MTEKSINGALETMTNQMNKDNRLSPDPKFNLIDRHLRFCVLSVVNGIALLRRYVALYRIHKNNNYPNIFTIMAWDGRSIT